MTALEWEQLQKIVGAAADLETIERDSYLNDICHGNPELRLQAERMLSAFGETSGLLENAIGSAVARVAMLTDITLGDRIGPYLLTETLGQGGMGTVYRATRADDQYVQSVAIKVVRSGFGANSELLARFRSERQILASINHPNIARLLDGGVTPSGLPYLVMEYIEGATLDQYIAQHRPSVAARLSLFRDICSAIQHAHQNLVIHRDLKPANVLVAADGTPKLLDFGIAKLLAPEAADQTIVETRAVDRLMTPEYASPEQMRGEKITTATDIYSLGVLLYELLTGRRPFQMEDLSAAEMERLVSDAAPMLPSNTQAKSSRRFLTRVRATDLDRIVLKAMHKVPDRRYATAIGLSADIERYLNGFPVIARPDSYGYRSRRFVSRNWAAVTAASVFLVTVIGLSISLAVQRDRSRREAASAEAVSQYLVSLFDFTQPNATQGRTVSARDILDQGTERLNKEWHGNAAVKARLLNTLGTVYYRLGALDRGISLLSEAESLYFNAAGLDSLELAQTATNLGDILETKGEYDGAMKQYIAALDIYERKKGHNSVEVADELDGIGSLHWASGDYKGAENLRKESISIFTRLLGPEAKETLFAKGNLEVVLATEGNYREAEPLAREILRERTRILGPYNSHTNISAENLSFILMKTARYDEAKPVIDQTLAVARKLFGEEHPDVGAALVDLGGWNLEMGHFEIARSLIEQGLAIAIRTAGPQSSDAAFDQDELAHVLITMGDPEAARPWAEKALATRLAAHPPSLPKLSQSYDHLGLINLAQANLPAARQQIEYALELRQKAFAVENDWIALSYNHLGAVLLAQHDFTGAQEAYAHALRIARNNFGEIPHPIAAEALYGSGSVLLMRHNSEAASSALNEALHMQQRLYVAGHPALRDTTRAIRSIESALSQSK